ncbi:KTSC domain-containing protein [Aliifodinibius sp. S!AR15-10]|uniref:KTSC domain-containing protein n=1 Tax=Aliifodinibius sp. S!AR15-10 TaxID=2950437 RepID=UPI002859C960|nr:KTSC domain-containing protein [Aliifodinibius sp. S!AR15-10]MDR8389504.1 KTSC domain-containing protein [Aliifodinibius sp. S!AR15-10]
MNRIPVDSSNIASIGYDQDRALLEIEFNNGRIYEYYDVPQYEYDQLMAAESHGSYANENIYDRYKQQRTA